VGRPFSDFRPRRDARAVRYGRAVDEPRSERFTTPDLDGVHLHAMHWGEPAGALVVLVHGGGANGHWWAHLAPMLASSFHVVAFDFRGHGESDFPAEIRPGDFERDLHALLDHLGAPEPVLVGHSMGGEIVLRVAAAGRVRPRALVLVDLARGGSPRGRRLVRRALTIRHAYPTLEEAVSRFRFVPPAIHADEALRKAIAARSVHRETDGRWSFKADPKWLDAVPTGPVREADITCPALLLRGSESGLCSEEGAKTLVAALPRGRLATLPRAGHHVHLDAPEATAREIRHFLHGLSL